MNKVFSSLLLCSVILATGCASYKATALNNPSSFTIEEPNALENNEIVVVAKTFDKADCRKYLDRDVIGQGYIPIQLYIQNNSDKKYQFSLDRISLPIARPEEVAEKVHTSTVGRAAGYGAGALIFWPLAIPAVIDGVKSSQANDALDIDFSSKAARDQTIQPYSYFNKILFIPTSGYQPTFTVSLIDQKSGEIKSFAVNAN